MAGIRERREERWQRHLEEVDDELRVRVKVVLDGLVEDVHRAALHGHVLEPHMLPRYGVVRHHHLQRVVKLVVPACRPCMLEP